MLGGSAIVEKVRKVGRSAAATVAAPATLDIANRDALIRSTQKAALSDSRFVELVRSADSFRDLKNWNAAQAAYAQALYHYPYQSSYWTQHGHMAKEQNDFVRAEISYRSACALGAKPEDVVEHLRFVVMRQDIDPGRYPPFFYKSGHAASQPPAEADVILFAKLVWRVGGMDNNDMVTLLRASASCDDLLATMVADARFERANRDWLELVVDGEL
jgi:hypothetical protein